MNMEMIPKYGSKIPKKWALAGMLTATVLLTVIVELLHRMPVVSPMPWWAWVMVATNFTLIAIAFAFVTIASKTMWQQIGNSALMIGTMTVLLFLYSLVP